MRLFNTLSQQVEPLAIRDGDGGDSGERGNLVTLYVCGITPYDTTHLGHAFINVIYDSLVRYLRWRGLTVQYVQNVTDIDDDILRKAREVGTLWDELGQRETEKYLADLAALNVAMPNHYVRASGETERMIELIEALLAQGLAYVRDGGWVYYSVRRDPDFGQLAAAAGYHGYESWLKTANERGNYPDDPRKDDPLDFVLWQGQQPGEPTWASPWGPGRPGWHIECSAMATKYLGDSISLHGGGADLIFPHHTCEIAQSEHATGARPFVHTWMHCAMVFKDGEKMSKSLGNLVLVRRDLLPRYTPDAIRVMLLGHHYRAQWEYAEEDMEAGAALAARLAAAANSLPPEIIMHVGPMEMEADPVARQDHLEFIAALEDDFQTPRALEALDRLAAHVAAAAAPPPTQVALLRELGAVLGLRLAAAAHVVDCPGGAVGAAQES